MTEEEYKAALKRISELMNTEDKKEGEELDKLADIVIEYENIHYPINKNKKDE